MTGSVLVLISEAAFRFRTPVFMSDCFTHDNARKGRTNGKVLRGDHTRGCKLARKRNKCASISICRYRTILLSICMH